EGLVVDPQQHRRSRPLRPPEPEIDLPPSPPHGIERHRHMRPPALRLRPAPGLGDRIAAPIFLEGAPGSEDSERLLLRCSTARNCREGKEEKGGPHRRRLIPGLWRHGNRKRRLSGVHATFVGGVRSAPHLCVASKFKELVMKKYLIAG